jgi:hypothetical protein
MAYPIPTKINGNALYSTDIFKYIYDGPVPASGSVQVTANTVGSCIQAVADYEFAVQVLPGTIVLSGVGYLSFNGTIAGSRIVTRLDNTYFPYCYFTIRSLTSGLTWTNNNWVNVTGSVQTGSALLVNPYLTITGV